MLCQHWKRCLKYILLKFQFASVLYKSSYWAGPLHWICQFFTVAFDYVCILWCCQFTSSQSYLYPSHFSECKHSKCKSCRSSTRPWQEQVPQQEPWKATDCTSVWTRASSRTMPRALLIVKNVLAISWGVPPAPWPSHAATFKLQHSFIPTHLHSKI